MADNGADIFLILLRPTRVPVMGESVSHLFQGQILVESLNWTLHNEEEQVQSKVRGDVFRETESLVQEEDNVIQMFKHMNQDVGAAQSSFKRAMSKATTDDERAAVQAKHERLIQSSLGGFQDKLKEATASRDRQLGDQRSFQDRVNEKRVDDAARNRNFEFTFTKRVDIASTQMLNSMKAGDIFPSGTLTIHKRSASVMDGTSLVFTIQKIRLLEYQLQVAVTDTMTEMMEKWTCEFGALAYVYKNPPSHYTHGNAGQAAAKTMSQGTMRAFTMKNIGSPI
jgi:type VI protein secretion system component Hcp